MTRPTINFEHVTLTVTFDLLLTNFIISHLSVRLSTLYCNAITQKSQPTNFILHTRIEDRERKTPIDFGVERLKVM